MRWVAFASAAAAAAGARWGWRRWRGRETLQGQVVLITGGSRGLGHMLARVAAAEGAKVAICARDAIELERARLNLCERGADVLARVCDVSDAAQVERLIADVVAWHGGIDVLINNAGVIQVGPLDEMQLHDFHEAMNVDFWGVVHTTLAVLPYMRARQRGRIVNITSIGGAIAVPHLLPYDCAKFAALGFSEGLRAELARDGVKVTTVVPGLMRTGSVVSARFRGRAEQEFDWFSAMARSRLTSMDVRRAARRIVAAVRRGDAELVLGWQARVMRVAKDLMPNLFASALTLFDRWLPRRGAGPEVPGRDIANARRLREFGAPAR
jgi:short-subunit dehydrogenase